MKLIKKIDIYILKSYLLLFAGTFFICLFIFMMQFLWKYVDELVGKGLSAQVLGQFFFYAGLTLVPMSMPLAILLASLISFGNMGEKLELLSMKAAGVPLLRILAPVLVVASCVCGASFYLQNKVTPEATRQLATLLWSMRQKSPELDIPEGIFYSEIPGYNLYVEHKDLETGMMYGMMIYGTSGGFDDTQIVLADSARLQSTRDRQHLKLTLYSGERFRNMSSSGGNMLRATIPYMRESFVQEVDIIPFDNNFNIMDANLFNSNAQTKALSEIQLGIDSLQHYQDSIGHSYYTTAHSSYLLRELPQGYADSARVVSQKVEPFDSIYARLSREEQQNSWRKCISRVQSTQAEFDFRAMVTEDVNSSLRRHYMEAQRKFTLSFACLLFFLIGAPLGAIIRKGGLGVPVVVSVLLFIFYYMVNVAGEKMAKTGEWDVTFGMWMSTMILLPMGMFLTSKANSDSVVFNIEGYRTFAMRLLGLRGTRKLNRKEVIIHDPDYPRCNAQLSLLASECHEYSIQNNLLLMPSYWKIFFRYHDDTEVININTRMESLIEELHNTTDNVVINALNQFPIMNPDAHTRPFRSARKNQIAGILLPLGLFLWFRIWRYRIRLKRDLDTIQNLCPMITERLDLHILAQEIREEENKQPE